jgi:hypothetical protein
VRPRSDRSVGRDRTGPIWPVLTIRSKTVAGRPEIWPFPTGWPALRCTLHHRFYAKNSLSSKKTLSLLPCHRDLSNNQNELLAFFKSLLVNRKFIRTTIFRHSGSNRFQGVFKPVFMVSKVDSGVFFDKKAQDLKCKIGDAYKRHK